jgi:NAD(P)-dependent dehydrogenase (short-subunit alcohol dehydrogenase family)
MPAAVEAQIDGLVAIVTGAASGIGRATFLALLEAGASVIAVDLNEGLLTQLMNEVGCLGDPRRSRACSAFVLDVRKEKDMSDMVLRTVELYGRIDILVNCAAILRLAGTSPKPLAELSVTEWDEVLATNLKGTFLSNRAVLATMIANRRGQIINLSSTSGRQGLALDSAYCASKFGVIGLSQSLAQEVSRYGIKVHVVLPAAVDTPLWHQNGPIPQPVEILPASRVAALVIHLLTLPEDTILVEPVIAPFRSHRRYKARKTAAPEHEQYNDPSGGAGVKNV